MAKLIYTDGTETHSFEIGAVFRIGRHPDNDLPMQENMVSRWHAEIRLDGERYKLIDIDSLNGTWVNGRRVKNRMLRNGDLIQIGNHNLNWQEEAEQTKSKAPSPFHAGDIVKSIRDLKLDEPIVPIKRGAPLPAYARAPEHLHLLLQIAQVLNNSTDLDTFLETTLNLVLESLEADRGAILVEEENALVTKKTIARKGEIGGEIPISSSIVGSVMDEGLRVLTTDARNDNRFDQGMSIRSAGIRSAICTPLWECNKARGVLYLDNLSQDRAFTEEDLDLAGAIAHQLALGIRHHKLIDTAKRDAVLRNQLERYHSPDVVDLLLRQSREAQQSELAPQEREVTIMFVDIVDFTTISSRLSPTETASLLNRFYTEITSVIFKYSGSVNKFIGDAVMALWGAPFSKQDDVKQAAACAAAILKSLYRMLWRLEADMWFKLRIGINTGNVVAGHIGSESIIEYTVVGDAVNVASRIQSIAKPNQILIGETTRNLLGSEFPLIDLGNCEVKGKDRPIRVFELVWKETETNNPALLESIP